MAAAEPATAPDAAYGGFSLAPLQLALPMAALREVLPLQRLIALPNPAPWVAGGIDLRGVVVPVLDLRRLLGTPAGPPVPHPCVVVLVHGGRMLGLLADAVTGVFQALNGSASQAHVDDPVAAVLDGSLRRADDDGLVNLLSPTALCKLPQVPLIDDPEPQRQLDATHLADGDTDDPARPMLLVRCGAFVLGIDAMSVHATVATPPLAPSVLAVGDCRGVFEFAGSLVPALDLAALCGLGAQPVEHCGQAFVVRNEAGHVALLIGAVIDVVPVRPQDRLAVPRFALPHPTLFAGAISADALPPELVAAAGLDGGQVLLIDGPALQACAEVQALSSTNTPVAHGAGAHLPGAPATGVAAGPRRDMLTYSLAGESATPLAQVSEILPFRPETVPLGSHGALRGLVLHRGRSIPLVCLSRLHGGEAAAPSASASVLVVESGGEWLGFVVPALRSIEPAAWEPDLGAAAGRAGEGDDLAQALRARKLALVGAGAEERMLRMVDLQRIATAIRTQGLPA